MSITADKSIMNTTWNVCVQFKMSFKKFSSIAFLVSGDNAEEALKSARRQVMFHHGATAYNNIEDITVANFSSRREYQS